MAGRGRGRGRSNLSFNVEELGFGRGEALPSAVLQPPPLFPPLDKKPCPLLTGEKYEYLKALKQEFRSTAAESPFFVKPEVLKKDVLRYSDKYQQSNASDCDIQWTPDWTRFPVELHTKTRKSKPVAPKLSEDKRIVATLNDLEKKEDKGEQNEEEGEEKEEGEGELEEEIYDEEEEEETDYIMSYFDNGEGMDEEDDNLDDGPIY